MIPLAFSTPSRLFSDYARRLGTVLTTFNWTPVERLAYELLDCWQTGRQVFLAGNGGSAANASHIANDLLYPLAKMSGAGLRVHSLTANTAVMSCIANDEGYDQTFALQLDGLARKGDVLIVLSGSGNSPNILRALERARAIGLTSYAVLGFCGGRAREACDVPIHFAVDDMQMAEDAQLVVGHMLMQWLRTQRGVTVAPSAND